MSAKQIEFMPVYEAADLWIASALRSDDSLFTPGTSIWSERWLGEARTRFLDKIEAWDGGDFFGKLETVLSASPGCPPEVYQLIGEAVYVTYLMVWKNTAGQDKKIENINRVLGWSSKRVEIPSDLHAGLRTGIMTPGAFFIAHVGVHPAFVLEFVDKWKNEDLCDELLDRDDPKAPWEFKKVVMEAELRKKMKGIAYGAPNFMRVALLHMAHPDTFEAMIINNKRKLAKAPAFERFTSESIKDPDRRIQQIRAGLESEIGHVDFWSEEIRPLWDDKYNPGDKQ